MTIMEVDDPTVTRVYVSGLPPSLSSDQLRSHFASKFEITDAHVVSNRRIGFVGFPDHESAKNASKYFNRSFIRMSRISVDLAKPVEVKQNSAGRNIPVSSRGLRERDLNPIAQESRKRKRDVSDQENAPVTNTSLPKDSPDESLSVQETKRRTRSEEHGISPMDEEGSTNAVMNDNSHPETQELQEVVQARSDLDWLRQKTSRVLDLVGPAELVKSEPNDIRPAEDEGSESQGEDNKDDADASPDDEQKIQVPNARLFIRNLPFKVNETELERTFSTYGKISETHLVKDTRASTGKGLAFIQFLDPAEAEHALEKLDGSSFGGRLMHILPASDKKTQTLNDFEISKLPLKKQKALKRKAETTSSTLSWNSLYMNPDAVLASVASRLGVSKADLLDPSSADAAVKQAHAETSVIQETKDYLQSNGINLEAFQNRGRDSSTLLLKNFTFGVTEADLTDILAPFGTIKRCIFPPTGTMAIVQYSDPFDATQALKQLAYRNLKGSVLYLERAPEGLFEETVVDASAVVPTDDNTSLESSSLGPNSTVFVRNLNFATSSGRLSEIFKPLSGFVSARVKTRTDPKRPGEILSMGYGFVDFKSKKEADAAVATMNGHRIDGHEILVQTSNKTLDAAETARKADSLKKLDSKKTKIIIKNLPFEASKKDIRSLFGAYGQLRTVRMPKKFDNTARGFAFADFISAKEASNAMDALSNTHLLGRRLVLEFAEAETIDPEETIKAMEKKVGRQVHLNTIKQMVSGSARKKFVIDSTGEAE